MENGRGRTLGFIGVGELASAVIDGLLREPVAWAGEILLSPRGTVPARELAARHPHVTICADNQAVADRADVLVLTVRPHDLDEACAALRLRPGTLLVSAVAGTPVRRLGELLGTELDIIRVIPLTAVRDRNATTVVFPAHPDVTGLFAPLGGTLCVAEETAFDALSAVTSTVSTLLAFVGAAASWLARQGVEDDAAERYVREMVHSLMGPLADPRMGLTDLRRANETPGGLNEQLRTTWFDEPNAAALSAALDGVLRRVSPPAAGGRDDRPGASA